MIYRKAGPDDVTARVLRVAFDRARACARAYGKAQDARVEAYAIPGMRAALAAVLLSCAGKLLAAPPPSYLAGTMKNTNLGRLLALLPLLVLAVLFPTMLAFAQAAASAPTDLSLDVALQQSLPIVMSFKGASALAIAVGVTQLVMKIAQSPLGNLAGKWKLLIVTGVSIVATYLGLVAAGTPWLSALIAGPLIAAVQVFAHQLIGALKPTPPPEA